MMLELGEVVISPQRSSANELSTSSPPNMLSYSNLDVLSEMKVFPELSCLVLVLISMLMEEAVRKI